MVAQERDERLDVGREREDVAVGHRPGRRHAVQIPGRDGRGGGAAADVGRPGREEARVSAVRAPEPEVDHGPPVGGGDDPAGLGRDQRLEVHLVQEQRLDELAREEIALDAQDRLARVHHRALRNGRKLARELDRRQPREQRRRADPRPLEVFQRRVAEPQAGQHLDGALEAGGDEVAPVRRQLAREELERDRLGVLALRHVGIGHRQLVLVDEQLGGRGGDQPDRR